MILFLNHSTNRSITRVFQKVYVQQPGSLVFFKSDKDSALKDCQGRYLLHKMIHIDCLFLFIETLKSLQREYEQLEIRMDQSAQMQ